MKVLYICTHNRCRSILSEAITNQYSQGKITARSAGSQPVGEVHPLSIKYLSESGVSTDNLQSQSWDEFEQFAPDLVITVCDSAAGESCPVWFGKSLKMHWGLSDPSKLQGSESVIKDAFMQTMSTIKNRVDSLLALDLDNLDREGLKQALSKMGATQ